MDLSKHYDLQFFKEQGLTRRKCTSCGLHFWSEDPETTRCGDPPCVEYSFIGTPFTKRPMGLSAMRERYLSYLESHGHTRVRRQPVVARWRDDIYLNIASISNYQPHVTGGRIPPPANPLAVSQPCIRLNDVDSVGRSGRHLTQFEMMAHHCFNYPAGHPFERPEWEGKLYFKNRTVELCHGFLEALGVDLGTVTYKENPWSGGGNAGPAFEVLTHGLEVATLVFMQWEAKRDGPIELKGERFGEMPMKIVDTGYGLERFVWASQGTPTIYEAVLPEAVEFLSKEADLGFRKDPEWAPVLAEHARLSCMLSVDTGSKLTLLREQVAERLGERGFSVTADQLARKLAPLEAVYGVADHTRCLTFMLGDGIVPSNVRAGYLARLLIRKSLRLLQDAGIDVPLYDVFAVHLETLKKDYPEIWGMRDTIRDIVELETERFDETMDRGRRLVQREVKGLGKGQTLTTERLMDLYDSHGMPPEIVAEIAAGAGVEVPVEDDFYQRVAERHGKEEVVDVVEEKPPKLPPTRLLFYDDAAAKEFNATALWCEPGEAGTHRVVLDKTLFYPEGGGQPADHGFLFVREDTRTVSDVQKWGDLVVHVTDGPVKVGDPVRGQLDWGRRQALTRNHTATHIVAGACRSVLGRHVWQSGAQKGTARSRLDITHYKRIDEEELREIETLANAIVLEGRPVEKAWLDRVEAEKKYGFVLYQGGVPPGGQIRVVRIPEFDVQACAGTHVGTTGELGLIKLFRTERIQDGVERIEFAAGLAALREVQAREDLLRGSAEIFNVPLEELPKTSQRFFDEWKQLRKERDALKEQLAQEKALAQEPTTVGGLTFVVGWVGANAEASNLRAEAATFVREYPDAVGISVDQGGSIIVAVGPDVDADAREILSRLTARFGGRGGGKPDMAQGKLEVEVTSSEEIFEALKSMD